MMLTDNIQAPYFVKIFPVQNEGNELSAYLDTQKKYFVFKRIFDILLSLLVILLILSWLIPVIALLIKADSGCSPFFVQKRVGKGGKIFLCYKFRTMIINGLADEKPAEPEDPRITRVGKFLRRSNIDELPQFFNVLTGRMSVIGPRPHMPADCRNFSLFIKEYKLRDLVKPGITGMAQVKGFHGPATDHESIMKRYKYDIFYIRHAGGKTDLKILMETIAQFIRRFNFSNPSWDVRPM